MKSSSLISFLFLLITSIGFGQYEPKGYYLFPIRPGQDNYLSGSMGELRSTHFHGGLDIKTSGVTGLSVYSSADGYISRIKITEGGYGNALYVKHPNGTTTVYAHLKEFSKPIQQYVIRQQYKQKSFTVDLYPGKTDFPVKRGDIIALSGNSGSSRGPHLHFEIRDENHHVLDPARFEFPELVDKLPPILRKVAFVTKSKDATVNGNIGRFEFDVMDMGESYILREPVSLNGLIGIEIYAHDRANGTRNWYGIPDLELTIDGKKIFDQKIRNISYGKMRDIMVHTNYGNKVSTGKTFNKLYVDDGNTLTFYEVENMGLYRFNDSTGHTISLKMTDSYGNSKKLRAKINEKKLKKFEEPTNFWSVHENWMKMTTPDTTSLLELYANNLTYPLMPSNFHNENVSFIWDLRDGLVDSIDLCNEVVRTNYIHTVYPNQESNFFNHTVNIFFPRKSLFDTLYLRYNHDYDSVRDLELFKFQNARDPLRKFIDVTLKPGEDYDQEYARVYAPGRKGLNYIGGTWNDDGITFRTRDLVTYTISYDSVSPSITPLKVESGSIRVRTKDKTSGIKSYRAELNGNWLLLKYDAKSGLLYTDKLDPNIPFRGEFILEVADQTGNLKYYQTKIE